MTSTKIDEKKLDGGYLIEWGWDEYADSPRDLYDNVGRLYTWVRGYESADANDYEKPQDFIAHELNELFAQEELEQAVREGCFESLRFVTKDGTEFLEALYKNSLTGKTDWNGVDGFNEWFDKNDLVYAIAHYTEATSLLRRKGVLMNVYRLEHSCVAYSTRPFNDPWDSGQVGFIWARRDELEKLGYDNDAIVEKTLAEEVALYSAWADGEAYWVRLTKDGEPVDSCANVIGDDELDDVIKAMEDEAARKAGITTKRGDDPVPMATGIDSAPEAHADNEKNVDVATLKQALKEAQVALQNAMRLLKDE